MLQPQRETEPRRDVDRSTLEIKSKRENRRRRETLDVFAGDLDNPQICRSID